MVNNRKVFYFDVETSGLDPQKHDILQIAYIIEVNGEVVCERSMYAAPFHPENADPQALSINGISPTEMLKFPDPAGVHATLLDDLGRHCDKFNKADKYYPCAYNGQFDMGFLAQFYKNCDDEYFGSWFNGRLLDPLALVRILDYCGTIDTPDHKLKTMAEFYGFSADAQFHDALFDVRTLQKILHRMTV